MKIILTFLLFLNFSFASYSVYFKGIKLGVAKNLNTIQENYLKADVTNSIARFLLGKDKFIYYNDSFKLPKDDKNTKYKKDTHAIIELIKRAQNGTLKDKRIYIKKNKYIDVTVGKNYKFVYTSKGRIKSKGYFNMQKGELIKFIDSKNDIEISKNNK